jgi:hypothetical protein
MSVLMLPVMDADAKGFSSSRSSFSSSRSSGFSSSRSSSSSSGFSSSRSSGSGFSSGSKPSAVKPSTGFSSSSSKPSSGFSSSSGKSSSGFSFSKPKSAFEIAQQRKSITPPPPKDTFVNDFKKNNAGKYPSTFATPPASRPTYIPPVTKHDGKDRPIEYNPQTRSYGFFDDFGKFMVYDAITDLALGAFQKEQTVYVQKTEELKKAEEKATAEELKQKETEENIMTGVFVFVGAAFLVMLFIGIKSTL